MRLSTVMPACFLAALAVTLLSREPQSDARLKGAFRRPEQNGWIFVHLEGPPAQIGYQHGYLLAPEIADAQKVMALLLERDTKRDWEFFRNAAQEVLWPHIEPEYREECKESPKGSMRTGSSSTYGTWSR